MPDGVLIRAPRPDEGAACRMLLAGGPLTALPGGREHFIACQDAPPFVTGALEYVPAEGAVAGVRLRVLRTHRRRGIGRALVARVAALAELRGDCSIIAATDAVTEPDGEPFLTALGFARASRVTTMDADAAQALALLVPLVDRLHASGRLPPDLRFVALAEAPREKVARLYLDQIGERPEWNAMPLAERWENSEYARCPVLMAGDDVAAFVLWRVDGEIAPVPARVVAPKYQGSWANALLMRRGIEDGMAAGGRIIRFEIPEDNRDTWKLAKRFGAKLISTRDLYVRRLAAA